MAEMAGGLTEQRFAQRVYDSLQAVSCPLVEDLYLQEEESKLEMLCSPSILRTDILAWICCRVSPKFAATKASSAESKDPHSLEKRMAAMGQELLLCRADELDLIRGQTSPQRQLHFLEQLLSFIPGRKTSAAPGGDVEPLLSELFSAENALRLRQMLQPSLDPWPAHIETLQEVPESPRGELPGVSELLQSTQAELELLQSKCDFLNAEEKNPTFSPSSLRLAAGDLHQQMMTFGHLYEADLGVYCGRDLPSFSSESDIFQRVHQKLMVCNTELEMQKETSAASESVSEEVKRLQTEARYWSRGQKHTLPNQLEEITRRIGNIASQLDTR
ncbi:HAUS augmin-like complex subunit 7 [Cyprinodon tularosa]|uniref:HAUS augmin-like complex subunit 7 n=1 Tax=Cyprinodon tularosa TaxID=77115 RepID=UPI0018E21EEA|nr:HAUS augmin-like complex subunit 7 [Cyprinodon tularosa]XP_038146404.1 HAUS augmin-like complex subunit 7 [Cyprinodon tularosa]